MSDGKSRQGAIYMMVPCNFIWANARVRHSQWELIGAQTVIACDTP